MKVPRTILFLCAHNAAKSVIAAAYCQRLAAQRGLDVRAASAGTEPDPEVSPHVATALRAEGIDVSDYRPRRVTAEDISAAWHVVSLGCDLGALDQASSALERWDDVPAPSGNVAAACGAIRGRVQVLLDRLDG